MSVCAPPPSSSPLPPHNSTATMWSGYSHQETNASHLTSFTYHSDLTSPVNTNDMTPLRNFDNLTSATNYSNLTSTTNLDNLASFTNADDLILLTNVVNLTSPSSTDVPTSLTSSGEMNSLSSTSASPVTAVTSVDSHELSLHVTSSVASSVDMELFTQDALVSSDITRDCSNAATFSSLSAGDVLSYDVTLGRMTHDAPSSTMTQHTVSTPTSLGGKLPRHQTSKGRGRQHKICTVTTFCGDDSSHQTSKGRATSRGRRRASKGGVRRGLTPTRDNNRLPPCRICGDAASGLHYGVNSCEACKRFFRRALKRKRHFKCRGQKNCVILGKKNNICGCCRYKRCLAVGMSKTNIKTGRYTHEKRAQDILEVQKLGTQCAIMDLPEAEVREIVRHLVCVHAKVITNADVPEEEMRSRALEVVEAERLKAEVFGFRDTLTAEQFNEVWAVTGLDLDERMQYMELVARYLDRFVHGYVRFGKGVPGFSSLSLGDQANLLKLARCEVWFLSAYKGFFKDLDVFYTPSRECRHRSEVERLLGKDYTETAFRLAARLQALNLTLEEIIVLKAVFLTFPDRCEMEEAERVEEIQWRMLRCLSHMLTKNHADSSLFHKVMDMAVSLRNLTELSQKALASSHFADAIRRNSKLVDMIIV